MGINLVAIDDQLQEAALRCVSLMHHYHDGERTATRKDLMAAEVGVVIAWLMELGPPTGLTESRVLSPVEDYLLARYGHEAGSRLNRDFVEAFEGAGMELLQRKDVSSRRVRD